ncbi:hypothetical protein [Stenotrophomonas rhizophila]|uniref:DUF4234 domain-containing protein n=1 Tax=Stenotrophomonas rhizophila TaxID=216778 RepID=A0A7V7YEH9_9GAMM|nr:hypothetical protein [Stenotrophomonas rhizophila]KAB7629428.1 hypothetical protein F9K92_13995 [Stenotrophomonas rhizophila]
MDMHDPYRAPATAPTAFPVLPAATFAATDVAPYYSPPTLKIAALSLTTLGIYPVYWFWRNWRAIKRETGGDQWPWARALFSPLWSFLCFSDLRNAASNHRRPLAFAPGLLGVAYFLLNFSSRFPNALWLFALFSFVPLLPVNSLLRRYHHDEGMDMRAYDRFGVWHILVVIFGGLFLLIALVGTFVQGATR